MAVITSLSLSARVTLDLHSLNNEGTEGNQQQTRMVHILDQHGKRAVVNAISGDMFKHILVEHLVPLLASAGQPLSPGARVIDADRINAFNEAFVDFCSEEKEYTVDEKRRRGWAHSESDIMTKMIAECSLTDLAGALVTGKRSVGRKSVVEFGWVVGLPDKTTTEQYFHVKYAPEGRGAAAGGETVAGRQAIFHRPASSGQYALICSLELSRIGVNDITRRAVVSREDRVKRAKALVHALAATLIEPSGAQRNTQNPHIVGCEGIVAVSSSSLPAPLISPLSDDYRDQVESVSEVLNKVHKGAIRTMKFDNMAGGVAVLQSVASELELPEG